MANATYACTLLTSGSTSDLGHILQISLMAYPSFA
jgi:hypothetical protein